MRVCFRYWLIRMKIKGVNLNLCDVPQCIFSYSLVHSLSYSWLVLGLLNGFPCVVECWLEQLLLVLRIEQIEYAFNVVHVVLLGTLLRRADGFEGRLAIGAELVVLGDILWRVLRELKEASRVVIVVRVAEIIELATESVLNYSQLLCSVFIRVNIELTCRGFEFVSLGGGATLANNFINTTLNV